LDLEAVTKRYGWGGPWVLSGLDLVLEEGSLTLIAGENGAGKYPIQQSITETCAGSRAKVRLGKLLLGFLLSALLGLAAMVAPIFVASGGVTVKDLVAGSCAQVIAALAAVGLACLCSRPVMRRHAWSVLIGLLVGLGTVLAPNGVPSRQLLVLFNKTGQVALALPIFLVGLETLALCVVAVYASLRVLSARS
jgi:hypothetical protein